MIQSRRFIERHPFDPCGNLTNKKYKNLPDRIAFKCISARPDVALSCLIYGKFSPILHEHWAGHSSSNESLTNLTAHVNAC